MSPWTGETSPPNSLWLSNAGSEPNTQPLTGECSVDTAIVGAGFTGLRAALELARAGQKVAVLEARTIGWGASGRTGGQVNPLPPEHGPEKVAALVGPTHFERYVELVLGSADELFDFIKINKIDCQARQKGWLRVDHCVEAGARARAIARAWNRFGAGIEFLDGPDLHLALGSKAFHTATFMGNAGAIHPLSYVRALAARVIDAGGVIFTHSPATHLQRPGQSWQIQTPSGWLTSDQVVLCTNGYTDGLWPGLAQSIIPLESIQAATAPLAQSVIEDILPGGCTFADTRRTILYGRKEPDNRLLLGTLGRLTERGDNIAHRALEREAVRIFPMLKNTRWEFKWGGRIAITRDRLPHFHEPAPGIVAGLGYNGRGVAMSNVMGRLLAERVLGKPTNQLAIPTSPVRTYPLHRYFALGARARMWWMRTRDQREIAKD